jgi:hypothetical protein
MCGTVKRRSVGEKLKSCLGRRRLTMEAKELQGSYKAWSAMMNIIDSLYHNFGSEEIGGGVQLRREQLLAKRGVEEKILLSLTLGRQLGSIMPGHW